MTITVTDPSAWDYSVSLPNSLQQWVTNNSPTLEPSSNALKDFFIARGSRDIVYAITSEMIRCYKERGNVIEQQREQMYSSIKLILQAVTPSLVATVPQPQSNIGELLSRQSLPNRIIRQQPQPMSPMNDSRDNRDQQSPSGITYFTEAKHSLTFAFIKLIHEHDQHYAQWPGQLTQIPLSRQIARDLAVLPPFEINDLINLIAQAVCRFLYEAMIEECEFASAGRYSAEVDRYLSFGKCTIGRTIGPTVILTAPIFTEICAKLPWETSVYLPAVILVVGLVLNEVICIHGCCGCCDYCGPKLGCSCASCHQAGMCEGQNMDQDFRVFPAPARRQQESAKCQWNMLAIGSVGTIAQIVAPILRNKYILVGSSLNAISAPVLLGVDALTWVIASMIIDELQKRGYVSQSPYTSIKNLLQSCIGYCSSLPNSLSRSQGSYQPIS